MSIANGIPAPAHLFADDGGRNAFEREAKGRSTIRWLSESVHSHGRNFLEASRKFLPCECTDSESHRIVLRPFASRSKAFRPPSSAKRWAGAGMPFAMDIYTVHG